MKKIIISFLIALFLAVNVKAQLVENIGDRTLNPTPKFEQLDRTLIKTNNLINRSVLFTDHARFYKDSVGVNNYSGWLQLYIEIYNGYFDNKNFIALDSVKSKVKQYKNNNIIPILIMDLEYNQLKPTALLDSLIIDDNGIFKDVFPRTQNPYETQRVFSFTPSTNSIYKNDYTFLVSKEFFFTNQDTLPSNILIDFGDGHGYKVVNWET